MSLTLPIPTNTNQSQTINARIVPTANRDGVILNLEIPGTPISFSVFIPRSMLIDLLPQARNPSPIGSNLIPTNSISTPVPSLVNSVQNLPDSLSQSEMPLVAPPPSPLPIPENALSPASTTPSVPQNPDQANQPTYFSPMRFLVRLPTESVRRALGIQENQSTQANQDPQLSTSTTENALETANQDQFIYLLLDGVIPDFEEMAFQDILNRLMQMQQPQGPPPASKKAIEDLGTVKVTREMLEEHKSCSICCDDFHQDKEVIQLPCDHIFDKDCIFTWLKTANSCPICRYELEVDDADYEKHRKERMSTRTIRKRETKEEPQETLGSTSPSPMEVEIPSNKSEEPTPRQPQTVSTPLETSTQKVEVIPTRPEKKKTEFGMKKGFLLSSDPKKKEKKEEFSGLKRGFLLGGSERKNQKKTRL